MEDNSLFKTLRNIPCIGTTLLFIFILTIVIIAGILFLTLCFGLGLLGNLIGENVNYLKYLTCNTLRQCTSLGILNLLICIAIPAFILAIVIFIHVMIDRCKIACIKSRRCKNTEEEEVMITNY